MFDINEVVNTINELENNKLTFDVCSKLADLYIIRDSYTQKSDPIIKEYDEILPSYHKFCEVKRKYQLGEISEDVIYKQLELLCNEISDFLFILYNNTDTEHEHFIIKTMLQSIINDKKSAI